MKKLNMKKLNIQINTYMYINQNKSLLEYTYASINSWVSFNTVK